jgi:hypothetical protein
MDIPGIGKDLHWWHGLTGVGGASLVACIAAGWPNGALMAAGFSGVGIGQWIDHKIQTEIHPRWQITSYPWNPSPAGVGFTVCGVLAVLFGVWRGF